MSLHVTKVPRALENKLKLFGFELSDLLLIFMYMAATNLVFGFTPLKLPIVWGGSFTIALVLFIFKKGKPENYLQHWFQFKLSAGSFAAGLSDTKYQPLLQERK